MSNYTKSTDFASKDSLASGNASKIVKGTEIDTEFNNIATAIATKADLASPTFTGTLTAGTATVGTATINSLTATIVGGSISGITDLAVADGGTGASTAANARVNLGTVADTASNGIAVRTAANTLTARAIAAGTGITVTNGDGVSGNPTIVNSGVTSVNGNTGAVITLTPGTVVTAPVTSVEFTGIPASARRITLMIANMSSNGAVQFRLQIGSGSYATSGYQSQYWTGGTSGTATDSFVIATQGGATSYEMSGIVTLANVDGNIWVEAGTIAYVNVTSNGMSSAGNATLVSGTLDRIRIIASTTGSPSATIDVGTFNILYD